MANNNNKNNNNVNQPRRKRNKKPVKRYSEEYSNRPNPYTGYSADGNYHPEAKTHTLDESSAANAMTENIPQSVEAAAEEAVKAAAKAAVETAKEKIKNTAEASVETENKSAAEVKEGETPSDNAENQTVRRSRRRKKKFNKQAADKANREKTEVRKAAVDKIAKGVAAHAVSEQIIDDIASISDVIEGMAKAEKKDTEQSESIKSADLYVSESIAGETESEIAENLNDNNSAEDINDKSDADKPKIAKPVELDEDDVLPFDLIADKESANDVEEVQEENPDGSEQSDENLKTVPLNPEDLIPVLDFEKLSPPVIDFNEPQIDDVDSSSEKIDTATIEEILNAVEQEKLEAAKMAKTISSSEEFSCDSDVIFDTSKSEDWDEVISLQDTSDEVTEVNSEEVCDSDSTEEISEQLLKTTYLELENEADEAYGESALSKDVESAAAENESETRQEGDNTAAGSESENEAEVFEISEDSDNISDQNENESNDIAVEEAAETVDGIPTDNEISTADDEASYDIEQIINNASPDISISEIEDEIFDKPSLSDSLNETETAIDAENLVENQDAVKEKIEKLIEAAELAEILRQESEEADVSDTQSSSESFNLNLNGNDEIVENNDVKPSAGDEDEVKEYHPCEKSTEDENVFESVLIVDDVKDDVESSDFDGQDDTLFLHSKETDECPTAIFKLPEGPIILPTDIDDGDFQEQWLDDEEDGDEVASRSKKTRRRISAFIGAVTLVLVVMVFVSVVKTVVIGINNIGGTGEKKMEYTEFISPVVLNDPEPFENVDSAENQMLLESSIWCVLDDIKNTADHNYNYDATGKIILPADEVEAASKKLFGNDVKLNMDVLSESNGNTLYYYNSVDHNFHISTGGIVGPSANITKIAQKRDYISLVVGYSSQADMSLTSSEGSEVECYKYMEYILALNSDGSYYIRSVKNYVEE